MEPAVLTTAIRSAIPTAQSTVVLVARYVGCLLDETYLTRSSNTAGAVILLITAELDACRAAQAPLPRYLQPDLLLDRMECAVRQVFIS